MRQSTRHKAGSTATSDSTLIIKQEVKEGAGDDDYDKNVVNSMVMEQLKDEKDEEDKKVVIEHVNNEAADLKQEYDLDCDCEWCDACRAKVKPEIETNQTAVKTEPGGDHNERSQQGKSELWLFEMR